LKRLSLIRPPDNMPDAQTDQGGQHGRRLVTRVTSIFTHTGPNPRTNPSNRQDHCQKQSVHCRNSVQTRFRSVSEVREGPNKNWHYCGNYQRSTTRFHDEGVRRLRASDVRGSEIRASHTHQRLHVHCLGLWCDDDRHSPVSHHTTLCG
jgi:hypothetical protein